MSAFDVARTVEQESMRILRPFVRQRAFNGQYVVTTKGPLSRMLQKTVGDLLYNADEETVYSAEVKAEQSNKHGNFFLETWSNRSRFTPGWMLTLQCDKLLYHFIDEDELYAIDFNRLREWAFHAGRIYEFPEKIQGKYVQMNDTYGRCVPIAVLVRELGLAAPFNPRADFMDAVA